MYSIEDEGGWVIAWLVQVGEGEKRVSVRDVVLFEGGLGTVDDCGAFVEVFLGVLVRGVAKWAGWGGVAEAGCGAPGVEEGAVDSGDDIGGGILLDDLNV